MKVHASGPKGGVAARSRRTGLTLVEVLVAMVLLASALLAWVRVQAAMLHAERSSRVRRELAAWMGNELTLQRNVRARACLSSAPGPAWRCEVGRDCVVADVGDACALESIAVTLTPPSGPALAGRTVVWWPLERADVGGAGP